MSAEPAIDYTDAERLTGAVPNRFGDLGKQDHAGQDRMASPNGPVDDKASAVALCSRLSTTAAALMDVLARETEILKSGRPREIATLHSDKIELSALYLAEMTRLKRHASSVATFAQAEIKALKHQLQELAAMLVENQDALAAILTVSERLIRTAAMNAVAATAAPSTYGASANITPPPDGKATSFAVNKSL